MYIRNDTYIYRMIHNYIHNDTYIYIHKIRICNDTPYIYIYISLSFVFRDHIVGVLCATHMTEDTDT